MPGFWRKCRITFRCFGYAVWFTALGALAALAWFNLIGLPDFLKTRLVATLHQRGVDLEFTRMRLRFIHGLVAENVRVGETNNFNRPTLTAGEVRLQLNYPALLHRRLQLDGLVLRNGKFTLPCSPTNALTLLNLQTELRFQTNDTWSLDQFRGDFSGVNISLAGTVAHAPEMGGWKIFSRTTISNRSALQPLLKNFANTLQHIRFAGLPQLSATLEGDARDPHSFRLRLNAHAIGVRTPWFAATNLQVAAYLAAPADAPTNFDSGSGFWTNLQPFRIAWTVRAAELRRKKLSAEAVECAGVWRAPELDVAKLSAHLGGGRWDTAVRLDVVTREVVFTNYSTVDPHAVATLLPDPTRERLAQISWKQPPTLRVAGALTLPAWTNQVTEWQDDIAPSLRLRGELAFAKTVVGDVALDYVRTHFSCTNQLWRWSDGELAQGKTRLHLNGEASAVTKNFQCAVGGTLDAASVRPFLKTPSAGRGFDLLTFPEPLTLALEVRGNLLDLDQMAVAGSLALTNVTIGTNAVADRTTLDYVRTHFSYASQLWNWSDLELAQGKTRLRLSGGASAVTKNFQCALSGTLDAASVRPFLTTSNAARGFGLLTFHEPLALTLDVRGNLRDFRQLTATGHFALTNAAIREQTVDSLTADLTYTNGTVEFLQPRLSRAGGAQRATGEKVTLDLAGQKLFIVGAAGHVDPMVVGRAIGPKTARAMEPYQFLTIPEARANGCIPLRQKDDELVTDDADIYFDVVGDVPFRWKKFETPRISGTVHWWKDFVIVTNAVMECYGGTAHGWGSFDVSPEINGTDFSFFINGTNVDFHAMAVALWSPTNELAGALAGTVTVTHANSEDWQTWSGYGEMALRDGRLWDVPVFGLISPLLNAVVPGLGNNRASQATGRFTMTNGVIFTDSLRIDTAMMQLKYDGTVDLRQNVNARVTALPMRHTPVFGSLMSWVLWPVSKVFECKVTGTLDQPKATPILLPAKLLLVPLHPIRSVEDLFTPTPTNTLPPW